MENPKNKPDVSEKENKKESAAQKIKSNRRVYIDEIKETLSSYKKTRIEKNKHRAIYKTEKKSHKKDKKKQKKLTLLLSRKIIFNRKIFISENKFSPNLDENIIEIKNVHKAYTSLGAHTKILKGIDLQIKHGEIVVILGASGGGKTTLLNILGGLDKADMGDVIVDGYNLSFLNDKHLTLFRRKSIGFVFQQYNLLPSLTAKENVEIGYNLAEKKKENILTMDEIIDVVNLTPRRNNYPSQMSGGEQQRVSIARALAKNPPLLFCDEPTGALDKLMAENILETLIAVNKNLNTTIVLITHNPQISLIAHKVIEMFEGQIKKVTINKSPLSPNQLRWT